MIQRKSPSIQGRPSRWWSTSSGCSSAYSRAGAVDRGVGDRLGTSGVRRVHEPADGREGQRPVQRVDEVPRKREVPPVGRRQQGRVPVHPVVELDGVEVECAQRVGHLVAVVASGQEVGDEPVAGPRQGIAVTSKAVVAVEPSAAVRRTAIGAFADDPERHPGPADRDLVVGPPDLVAQVRHDRRRPVARQRSPRRITTSSPGRCDVRSGRASSVTGGTPRPPPECGLGMRAAARGRRSPSRPGGAGRTPARRGPVSR